MVLPSDWCATQQPQPITDPRSLINRIMDVNNGIPITILSPEEYSRTQRWLHNSHNRWISHLELQAHELEQCLEYLERHQSKLGCFSCCLGR